MNEQNTLLIQEISQKTNKSQKEIQNLIDEKIKKFSGLLTEQGAIFMVEKELGLKKNIDNPQLLISDLEDGQKNIDVKGKIKIIFPVKEFEKSNKKGKLLSFILSDESGEIRVTLWNDQTEKYDLTINSEIIIHDCIVTSYNEKKQITLGFSGEIEILNKAEEIFEKINNIKGEMNNVNIIGRIIRKFPVKEFETNDKKGKLCNFQFGDETNLLRVTAWNEKAEEINKFKESEVIKIKNAYTKSGMFGVELHLGYNTIINKSNEDLPTTVQIMKENMNKKDINQLVENENIIINGKITEIENKNISFLICEKCQNPKIEKTTNGNYCSKCGEVKGKPTPVINLFIEDESGKIKTVLFGEDGLKVIEMTEEEFIKEVEKKSSEKIIEELNEKIIGTNIELFGYCKTNTYSNETEFRVKEILKIN